MITLTLKSPPAVPLEAEAISPDCFAALSRAEIGALPVQYGRRTGRLDEFFEIDGDASEKILLRGDLSRVKWIGRGMTRGRIRIEGNAGMHLGAFMQGGAIEVTGDVSDWLGAEMRGGEIHVQGDAGGHVGAAYRGGLRGMRGGVIRIDGCAGAEVGMKMRRGLIAIGGAVGDFAGLQMKGGTICLLGGAGERVGAWMTRGTIISLAPMTPLPTYVPSCDATPTVLRVIAKKLAAMGMTLPVEEHAGIYQQFSGDFASPGRGELFVWKPHAVMMV